jgi:hypothetical protein
MWPNISLEATGDAAEFANDGAVVGTVIPGRWVSPGASARVR